MGKYKYLELADRLRTEIQTGAYLGGQKLPSENELAVATGYSRQTIRQAISLLESEGLADRRQGSGTYVRKSAPRRPVTRNIAVVTTYIGEYIFPAILHGIDQVLAKNGYTSMLAATHNRTDYERRILSELLQKPIDGLIVEGTKTALPNPNLDLYAELAAQGLPIVFINGYYPELKDAIYVVADDHTGGRIAGETLLRRGHTQIAGIFKSDDMQGHRRYIGFAEALRGAALPAADHHLLWYTTETRGKLIAAQALQAIEGCTAVVCYNDEIALQLVRLFSSNGILVPQDLSLVSFDNSTIAQLSAVPFLSLTHPKDQIGILAAEKLLLLLQGRKVTPALLPWSFETD